MDIEHSAPAVTRQEREMAAAPERVFDLLVDVAGWPRWQSAVTRVDATGPLAEGSTFRWRSGGVGITSTVEQLQRPRSVGWRGTAIGTRAVHVWHLEPTASGGTRVTTEESMSGWLPRLLPGMVRRTLDRGVRETLDALAEEAEGRGDG